MSAPSSPTADAPEEPTARRLNVADLQRAIGRIRDAGTGVLPAAELLLDRAQRLRDRVAIVQDGGTTAELDDALLDLFVLTLEVAERYGIQLAKSYQRAGYDSSLRTALDRLRAQTADGSLRTVPNCGPLIGQVIARLKAYELDAGTRCLGAAGLAEVLPELQLTILAAISPRGDAFLSELDAHMARQGHLPPDPEVADTSAHCVGSTQVLAPLVQGTYCPFATRAQLWLAPEYDTEVDLRANVRHSLPWFRAFTRAAGREPLDAFVFRIPVDVIDPTPPGLSRMLRTMLDALDEEGGGRRNWRDEVHRPGWRLYLLGEKFFVPVFAPLYPPGHSRHTFGITDHVIVLWQPDSSFHVHLAGWADEKRASIRDAFTNAFQWYPTGRAEADKFVLPRSEHDDAFPQWYDDDVSCR